MKYFVSAFVLWTACGPCLQFENIAELKSVIKAIQQHKVPKTVGIYRT